MDRQRWGTSIADVPASSTEHLDRRHADMLWRVRAAGNGWVYLLVLLEFQSTVDRRMALRMVDYSVRIMNALGLRDEYPLTIPVVVYNGTRPWTAPTDVRGLLGPVPDPLVGVVPRVSWGWCTAWPAAGPVSVPSRGCARSSKAFPTPPASRPSPMRSSSATLPRR